MSLTKCYALRERIGVGGFGVEAEIVASLEHPHIIPLFDYWRDPNGAYLVMCFMRGGTLRQALASGQWDVARTGLGTVLGGMSAYYASLVTARCPLLEARVKTGFRCGRNDDEIKALGNGITSAFDVTSAHPA